MIGSIAAACGGLAFIAIGIAALLAPGLSSVQYGLPATDRTALSLVRAVGARDFVLGLIVLALLASRNRAGLEIVLGISVLVTAADAAAVGLGRDDAGPRHLAIHVGGGAALLAAWGLVRGRR